MNIPTIGGPRGIFETFVPGVFLLLNAIATVYFSQLVNDQIRGLILDNASELGLGPVIGLISLVIIICFGYLIGILIRLIPVDVLDSLSGRWLRRADRGARQKDGSFKLWASEKFPYLGWIEEACKLYLPAGALDFYNKTWGLRKRDNGNTRFFDFCKVLVNSVDERSANEIYIAEALSRYMSGMFFALSSASVLMLINIFFVSGIPGKIIATALFLIYVWATSRIVRHLRPIRVKEVETVFDATFVNREKLEVLLTNQVEEPQRIKHRRRVIWVVNSRL
jgi:hypothetical protein